MRNPNRLTTILVCLVAMGGISTTAIGAIGACCANVWAFQEPVGEECAFPSTRICEQFSVDDPNGKESSGLRTAECRTYYGSQFARLACGSHPGPGWKKLPAVGPGGYCCWVKDRTWETDLLGFEVDDCSGDPCEDGEPITPIEP